MQDGESEDPISSPTKTDNTRQDDTYEQLHELCGLMTHVNVEPSDLATSRTVTPPTIERPVVTTPINDALIRAKRLRISYSDLNSAFGVLPFSIDLPVIDVNSKMYPPFFYGCVCYVQSATRVSVFPLHEHSKSSIVKFLEFQQDGMDDVQPVRSLPDNKEVFGYLCGQKAFQRVEVNSSTSLISSYDTGELLGSFNMQQLFVLPSELVSIPSLRIKLALYSIKLPTEKMDVMKGRNFMIEHVLGKVVKVKEPLSAEHFTIGIMYSSDDVTNYNDLLVKAGHAFKGINPHHTPNTYAVSSTMYHNTPKALENMSSRVAFHLPPRQEPFQIYPTVVISPSIICAQVFHRDAGQLEKLLEDMNILYHESSNSDYVPTVGELCAARFSSDDLYYRAEVIRINNNGLIDVRFVDYGNKETVSFKDLHYLKHKFLTLPKQALSFCLSGVSPIAGTWSQDACKYVKDLMLQQQVQAKVVNESSGKYHVQVYHPDCLDVTINDQLLEKGFAEKMVEMRGVRNKGVVSPKIGRGSAFNHTKSPGSVGSGGNITGSRARTVLSPIPSPGKKDDGHHVNYVQDKIERQVSFKQSESKRASLDNEATDKKGMVSFTSQDASSSREVEQPVVIPNISLSNGTKAQVVVVHVETPELFYVVSLKGMQKLVKISEAMQEFDYKPVDGVNIGDFCVAKYSRDNCYRRVEVVKTKPNKALVLFVDYGNKQPVFINDLYIMDTRFATPSKQAVCCSLDGVSVPEDGKWSEDDVVYFKELVLNKSVNIEVNNACNNSYKVKLVVDSDVDVACKLNNRCDPISVSLPAVDVTQRPVSFPSCTNLGYCQLTEQCTVVISDITSVNEFYVHACTEQTKANIGRVVLPPSEFHQQSISIPLPNDYLCCVKFIEDSQWYRACIVSTNANNSYTVRFIDFGNYGEVSKTDVALCPESLSNVPVLAIQCSLYNVSEECSLDQFKSLTAGKMLVATVIDQPASHSWCVSLTDTSESQDVDIATCLNSQIVSNNVTAEIIPSSKNNSIGSPVLPTQSISAPPTIPSLPNVVVPSPTLPTPTQKVKIMITDITNPCMFYAEFITNNFLQYFVQGLCKELPIAYSNPSRYVGFKASVGAYGCAKFSQDGCWYRCKVIDITASGVQLFFIDYGNKDCVSNDSVYRLDEQFASVPAQAVQCSLANISPARGSQWSHTSIEYLKSVGSSPLYAVVDSVDKDTVNLELYTDEECSRSFADSLIENGLAVSTNSIQVFAIPQFTLPEALCDVIISDVTSPLSFYVQLALPNVQRTLAGLQSTLSTYAKSAVSLPPHYQLKVGDFCCALFSEDGCWYRALITSVSHGKVTVLYVDFGNSCVVGLLDLRLLNEELSHYPRVACEVALSGVANETLVSEFKSLTDGKILNMQIVNCNAEPIQVKLSDPTTNGDLNQQLNKMATTQSSPVKPLSPVKSQESQGTCIISSPRVPSNDMFKCVVVHIDSLTRFFVQVIEKDNVHNLMELMENVGTCAIQAPPIATPIYIGQLCLAQFSGDYYRGRILEISGDFSRIYFVDFGNTDVVRCSDLKAIPAHLLSLPAQALKCALVSVPCNTVSDSEIIKKFTALVGNVEMKCHVVNMHPLTVELHNGDAVPVTQILGLMPVAGAVECHFELAKVNFPDSDNKIVVMINEVEKPDILWMQLYNESTIGDFQKMTMEMNTYCAGNSTPMEDVPVFGQLCCARFSADGTWYRGQVVGFADNGDAVVHFIDFGNRQQTSVSSLRIIPRSLLNIPAQAVPCLPAGGCSDVDYDKLPGLVLNKQFQCVKEGVSPGGFHSVRLFDPITGSPLLLPKLSTSCQ